MKRAGFILMVLCLLFTLGCQALPSLSGADTDNVWGGTPTEQTFHQPTPKPKPQMTTTPSLNPLTSETLTLTLDFGEFTGTYTGQLLGGLPNGSGTFTSSAPDGAMWTYDGQWQSGHFNGMGTVTWDYGYTYSGYFVDDYLNGGGWEAWDGITRYEGEYSSGYYHGMGTLYNQHGEIMYSGVFHYGRISEFPQNREERLSLFKQTTVPASADDLFAACENIYSLHVQITGTVFDLYTDEDANPTFCDFLLYLDGISDTNHIICVYYTLSEGEAVPQEGQSLTIWGTTGSLYAYTTVDGQSLTVPLVEAISLE